MNQASSSLVTDRALEFQSALLNWFKTRARKLPWRETADPYKIWLSEVILQQTRVDQATPYYLRMIEKFPTVSDLASASIDDLLIAWEGLGYYSRARNLHEAAREIVDRFDGQVPNNREDLLSLPGIGPYTASAILSIAYAQPYGVLDGNVIRVLSRLLAFPDEVNKSASKKYLQSLADDLVAVSAPRAFNESIMELGATVCTPRNPQCPACPIHSFCLGTKDDPEAFPRMAKRAPIPHHDIAVGVLSNNHGELFAQRRPLEGLLGGLWEFPGGKRESGESIEDACRRELKEELGIDVEVGELLTTIPHAYSHFKITLHAFRCNILSGMPQSSRDLPVAWIAADRLEEYAFPKANRKLIETLAEMNQI